jgi:ATP-dependent protease ClpP protease subunit
MAKDILLMGNIGQYNVLYFFDQIKEATKDNPSEDMVLRVNTEGGQPDYMLSILEKVQELKDQITIKGGAQMHSSGFFAMCYVPVERVECSDITQAVIHRAAWSEWMEKHDEYKGSIYDITLTKTNKDLEKALRARIDVDVLEALPQFAEKNLKLKDIFSMDSRIEIVLTGADLKKIGLVSKVNKMTPSKQAELTAQVERFKNCNSLSEFRTAAKFADTKPDDTDTDQNNTNMTLEELKAKFPAVYAQVKAEGHAEGVAAEFERCDSIMVFNEIDPAGVKAAIESKKPLSPKQMAEMSLKSFNAEGLKLAKKDSSGKIITKTPTTTEGEEGEQDEVAVKKAEFEASLKSELGLKK